MEEYERWREDVMSGRCYVKDAFLLSSVSLADGLRVELLCTWGEYERLAVGINIKHSTTPDGPYTDDVDTRIEYLNLEGDDDQMYR